MLTLNELNFLIMGTFGGGIIVWTVLHRIGWIMKPRAKILKYRCKKCKGLAWLVVSDDETTEVQEAYRG